MNYNQPKYYSNIFNSNNRGKRILSIDKLYEGQNYLITYEKKTATTSWGNDECGPLTKKTFSGTLNSVEMAYYGIYIRMGTAKYDGITMTDQIHEYHWQEQCTLADMLYMRVYEYKLDIDLQTQLKLFNYYKKTAKNLCIELNICEDIEQIIRKYLI
jgi:hypothetical protein